MSRSVSRFVPIALLLITFFDLLIIWLTWREYRDQKLNRSKPAAA